MSHQLTASHAVADDYRAEVLISWGDGLAGNPNMQFPVDEARQTSSFDIEYEGGYWAKIDKRFEVTDEPNEMYHFVSEKKYLPDNNSHNRELLTEGIRYCARLNDDGSGQWLPMIYGQCELSAENGFSSQADVLIDRRQAAALLGATLMDRPEDLETNAVTDRTYLTLTINKVKPSANADNHKAINRERHIVEMIPPGEGGNRDHVSDTFRWDIFLQAGEPLLADAEPKQADSSWFTNPDNLAFDVSGRLWMSTDVCGDFGFADGLWCSATTGEQRAMPKHFFAYPQGADLFGPEFTPDGKTPFVAVQHLWKMEESTFDKRATRWPDFQNDAPPRSSVMVIHKDDDGGFIGE
ncbi:MAG: secreted PhoX family phosphatase [Oceanicoccus sp.]|jgi:secreted PhoX family phosphatase